jgi:hypothetical protein
MQVHRLVELRQARTRPLGDCPTFRSAQQSGVTGLTNAATTSAISVQVDRGRFGVNSFRSDLRVSAAAGV